MCGTIYLLLCIFACYKIADMNGRNTILAAVMGALFNVFAVIVYLIIGKRVNY